MEILREIRMRYANTENVTDSIYYALDEAIVKGILPPGSRLLESELAESMDVSRTPIREALKRLITDELIEYSHSGNIRVKVYTVAEICDVIQAIEGLRDVTTYFTAETIDKVALARLSSVLDAIDELDRLDLPYEEKGERRYKYDEMFHMIVCESVGNEILLSFYKKLVKKFNTIKNTTKYKAMAVAYSETANNERKEIFEAFRRKDMDRALAIAVKHSNHSFNRMKSFVNTED